MLTLLFDPKFWYGVIALAVIVLIIFFCFKYPESRPYVFSVAGFCLVAVTAWCIYQLNLYYNAEGGIYGKLTTLTKQDTTLEKTIEENEFLLKNIVLKENDGEYSTTVTSSEKLSFENKNYILFVNKEPCSNTVSSIGKNKGSLRGEYHYIFQNDDLQLLCEDTLKINFSYYENGYQIKVTTTGGSETVNYWNTYFTRNNFVITINAFSYEEKDPKIIEDNQEDYVKISYYVDDEIFQNVVYLKDTTILNFPTPYKEGFTFKGWSKNRQDILTSVKASEDMSLYAVFTTGQTIFNGEQRFEERINTNKFEIDFSQLSQINLNEKNIEITFDYYLQYQLGGITTGNQIKLTKSNGTYTGKIYGEDDAVKITLNGNKLIFENQYLDEGNFINYVITIKSITLYV